MAPQSLRTLAGISREGAPSCEWSLKAQNDTPVGELGEPVGGYRWPGQVPREMLDAVPVVRGNADGRVKTETLDGGAKAPRSLGAEGRHPGTEASRTKTTTHPGRADVSDAGSRERGEQRFVSRQGLAVLVAKGVQLVRNQPEERTGRLRLRDATPAGRGVAYLDRQNATCGIFVRDCSMGP